MSMPATAHDAPGLVVRIEDQVPVLTLPSDLGFDALRDWLREQLPPKLEEIGGRTSRLDLGTRRIELFLLRRVVHLLREEFSVEVSGLYVRPEEVHGYAERELKLKLFLREPVEDVTEEVAPEALVADDAPTADEADEDMPSLEEAMEAPPAPILEARVDPGRRTLTLQRTLRSGSAVKFDGDVLLFGDVNPGAQIIAAGNILVLGALKGMAHAGATGDESSVILGFDLRPTQLRIGRRIAIPPADEARAETPEVARVVDGQIVIEPYRAGMNR